MAAANPRLAADLKESDSLTAGQLLKRLRNLKLSGDFDNRIGAAIERRNRLVHHTFEDPELARAIATDQSPDETIARIDELARDCAALTIELQLEAVPAIEAALGASRSELLEMINSIDPQTISDPNERLQLEAVQALGSVDGIESLLEALVGDEPRRSSL